MANRQKGETAITVDGVVYTLRLTVDATAQLEDACSTPEKELFFPDILAKVLRGSAKHIRLFVWACLREHHPAMTVAEAGALIDAAGGQLAFSKQVQDVVESTQPDAEDLPRPQKAQTTIGAGIGGRSTSKRAKSA